MRGSECAAEDHRHIEHSGQQTGNQSHSSPLEYALVRHGRLTRTAILVVEPDDVVFAQIGAGLHLDDLKRNATRVLETMRYTVWDIRRLVFAKQEFFFSACDERGAAHHDPVLRAVMMHLQRQAGARHYHDAFNLKAV